MHFKIIKHNKNVTESTNVSEICPNTPFVTKKMLRNLQIDKNHSFSSIFLHLNCYTTNQFFKYTSFFKNKLQ